MENEAKTSELLPCPVCGNPVALDREAGLGFISCNAGPSCAGRAPFVCFVDRDIGAAIDFWNRPQPEQEKS